MGQAIRFSLEELRTHFSKIGKDINNADVGVLDSIPMKEISQELADTPEEEEILEALRGMKDGAPGPDKITCSMLRKGGETLRIKVVDVEDRLSNLKWVIFTSAIAILVTLKFGGVVLK